MAVRTRIAILSALLILSFAAALWFSTQRSPSEAKSSIDQLRRQRWDHEERQKATADLARMGDDAIPSLAAALKGKDTALDHQYDRWRAQLPPEIQQHLPTRPSKDELRRGVASSIHDIGPTASRALVGALEHALEPGRGLDNMEFLRALYWSIPESPKAVQILSNWLAHPAPGLPLFGMKDAEDIWPAVPQLAPLLAEWLKVTDTANEAAEGLSFMGTNAHFAIPQIIELAEKGYVGAVENAKTHIAIVNVLPGDEVKIYTYNKAAALLALGRLKHATPEVLSTLARNITNSAPLLRAITANAIGDLGPAAVPLISQLVNNLDETHRIVLCYQVEALGKIGSAATEAIPHLRRLSNKEVTAAISGGETLGRIVRWEPEPLDLPLAAAVSLGQIDPGAAKPHLTVLAFAFQTLIPSNTVVQLRPLRSELLPLLEEHLQRGSGLLAFNTLILDPGNKAAADLLRAGMQNTNHFQGRSVSARSYFHAMRDTNRVLEVFRQTLTNVTSLENQTPLNLVAEVGPAARNLAPQIKPLLKHEDHIMRMLAGKALRAIAPEEMPPINER